MTDAEQRAAARAFVAHWQGRGYEKGESQPFWLALLRDVYGVKEPEKVIEFEDRVMLDHTSFIDGMIPSTHVLIEQKELGKDLRKAIRQSDGTLLSPYQQALRYSANLPYSRRPRYIVTCNFETFLVYDMEHPQADPEEIHLKDLPKEYYRLQFLVATDDDHIRKELEVSVQAGSLVGRLYDALLQKYIDPEDEETLKSLNVLCVRLVFCLYAEDAGIFGGRAMFHDYLESFRPENLRIALIDLFHILDTKEADRDPYAREDLLAFPYVNGGLFSDEHIIIPRLDETIRTLLLDECSEGFDWSEISPTIFGAVFESTLNPDTRRKGGMHYTSVENIHKVIDPLFLTGLHREFSDILQNVKTKKSRAERLRAFQEKLAGLRFLDPACGSGNFLTETYLSLRRLENQVIDELTGGQMVLGELANPIRVSISQFYGIEINDFAVTVAKTALWIAESQMMKETEAIVHMPLDFLPLKTNAYIHEGNALRMDWEAIVPNDHLSYIMGNPPFVGGMYMSAEQKQDIRELYPKVKGAGEFDYVTGWYKKAVEFIADSPIQCAFVSTNSICQGSHVITFWKYLMEHYNVHIDFAYTSFIWNSESQKQAHVHCVIVGFSKGATQRKDHFLFTDNGKYKDCEEISPYLMATPTIFIESRSNPLCDVPHMRFGSMPRDGGGFVLTSDERVAMLKKEPLAEKWIHPYIGANEFLKHKERYCLWLVNASPSEIAKCPTVKKRIEYVRDFRLASKAAGTRKFADRPTLFCQIAQPDCNYLMVPKTSSERRRYVPMGFMSKDVIASDSVFLIPNASIYHFDVLTSNVHNAWMRVVAGRLKSDYRYSKDIVYNNFPWPEPDEKHRVAIERTAQGILDARAKYPEASLSDLYDELTMPPELRRAHQENDKAVMTAYGWEWRGMTEMDCVAALMHLYQQLAAKA